MRQQTKVFQFRLSPKLEEKLKRLSEQEQKSVAAVIRDLIENATENADNSNKKFW